MNSTKEISRFWRITHYLVSNFHYRVIFLSKNQDEIWLMPTKNKKNEFPIVRLFVLNLDWSNSLRKDLRRTALNGENIRKSFRSKKLKVRSYYLTPYPPVDDYDDIIKQPFFTENNKVELETVVLDQSNTKFPFQIADVDHGLLLDNMDNEEEAIQTYKTEIVTMASQMEKEEKALLDFAKPFLSYILIGIQLIMFLLLEFNGGSTNPRTLLEWGAKVNYLIAIGEWWRFITPIFLHIGIWHLIMNSIALYYIGTLVERIFGKTRFLFIYLFAGISGTIASYLLTPSLSAGASGAIFGCFGALIYFAWIYPSLFFRTLGWNVFIVIGINLLFGFTIQGIDNAGHIGGLLGGFLATAIVHFPRKKRGKNQFIAIALAIVLFSISFVYSFSEKVALNNTQSAIGVAHNYIEEEDFQTANHVLDMVNGGKNANYYFLLSYTELQLNEIEIAENHLLQAIELNPQFHEAYYNLAVIYVHKDIDQAKRYLSRAMEIAPKNPQYEELWNKIKE